MAPVSNFTWAIMAQLENFMTLTLGRPFQIFITTWKHRNEKLQNFSRSKPSSVDSEVKTGDITFDEESPKNDPCYSAKGVKNLKGL